MTATEDPGMILLGRVSGLFGVKGWIRVYSDTEPRDNILNYSPWYLRRQDGWQPYEVIAGRPHGKGIVAHLANCPDRDAAAELIGSTIAIWRDQLPAAAEDEYYWSDLRGLKVITTQGVELGRVVNLMETGANDVLVVREAGEQGREHLIPFIRQQVIQEVDLENGQLTVDWDPEF
ncbi:MAG: ribosome maturation factor RimM [Halobacteria archaeon]|nr:ribosome maturation factor RimM [Halobacteria archaeon]